MDKVQITKLMEDVAKARGLKLTTIGQYALQDRHIYQRLKSGGAVHDRTLSALSDWLENNREPSVKEAAE